MLRSLSAACEIWKKFLAPGYGLAQPWPGSHLESEPADRSALSLAHLLSLSLINNNIFKEIISIPKQKEQFSHDYAYNGAFVSNACLYTHRFNLTSAHKISKI